MSIPETTLNPNQHQSVFRSVRWLPRDVTVGIGLWLVLLGSVCMSCCIDFGPPSTFLPLTAYLIVFGAILVGYPFWMLRRRMDGPIRLWPGTGKVLKEFVIAIPVTLGLWLLTIILNYLLTAISSGAVEPSGRWTDVVNRLDYQNAIILVVLAVTVGPIAEEIFFRGFLYNALRSLCPVGVAICLQAALFGSLHLLYHPIGMAITACMGLVLAGIYEWRKTLLASVFAHAMHNGVTMVFVIAFVAHNLNAPVLGVRAVRDDAGQVVITEVAPNTGAEKADFRPGDVILTYGNLPIDSFQQLIQMVRAGKVGDTVRIDISRDGTRIEKQVTLGKRPKS